MMHLIIHMFNTSMVPYISLDQYLNQNLYTIPNIQNMRFFCCPVYIYMFIILLYIYSLLNVCRSKSPTGLMLLVICIFDIK